MWKIYKKDKNTGFKEGKKESPPPEYSLPHNLPYVRTLKSFKKCLLKMLDWNEWWNMLEENAWYCSLKKLNKIAQWDENICYMKMLDEIEKNQQSWEAAIALLWHRQNKTF